MTLTNDAPATEMRIKRVEFTWCLPFWLRGGPRPLQPDERFEVLSALRDSLGSGNTLRTVTNWRLDENYFPNLEPYRPVMRTKHRLVADLSEPPQIVLFIRDYIANHWPEAGLVASHISSMLRLENFGLGSIEYYFTIYDDENIIHDAKNNLHVILLDTMFWQELDDFLGQLVEEGMLPIQTEWQQFAETITAALQENKAVFPETNTFFLPGLRKDDLLLARGMNLVLFRSGDDSEGGRPDSAREAAELDIVSRIANAYNAGAPIDATAYYHDVGPGSLDILVSAFGMVALVTESEAPVLEKPNATSERRPGNTLMPPSKRLQAMWRYVHLHYAALTEAADGLRFSMEKALLTGSDRAEEPSQEHRKLTRIVGLLSVFKYSTVPGNFEADDFEDIVYGNAYKVWGLGEADQTLSDAISDADRITSRLSEIAIQKEQRKLNALALILAVIGSVGAILSGLQLIGLTISQYSWDKVGVRFVLFTGYVLVVAWIAVANRWVRVPGHGRHNKQT
jgi:hypothetical protein